MPNEQPPLTPEDPQGDPGKPGPNDRKPEHQGLSIGIGLGLAIGVVFGLVVLDNLALGIGPGLAIGIAIGLTIDQRNAQINKQKDAE